MLPLIQARSWLEWESFRRETGLKRESGGTDLIGIGLGPQRADQAFTWARNHLDITFVVESTTIELVGNDGVAKGYGQNRVG